MDLDLYYVDAKYIKNLHKIDSRVEYHHGAHDKPYLGVILNIKKVNYFVPLSSPKPKHNRMRENISFIKLMRKNKLLAVLNLNNMVPVPLKFCKSLIIKDVLDLKYQELLNNEYFSCLTRKKDIVKSAKLLHRFVCDQPNSHQAMLKYCCDFDKLETYYHSFD